MKTIATTALSLMFALTATAALAADAPAPTTPAKAGEHGMMAKDGDAMKHHMFDETDSNHDGLISKEEWVAKGDKMFADIDANHDGKISDNEMKAHHHMKRAEWEKRRAERMESMGEHKGMGDMKDMGAAPAAKPAPDAAKK